MIEQIFHIILWITVLILVISGIDDLFIDVMYWLYRRKYKKEFPEFHEIEEKPEKPVAIMIGAWKEYAVIGRTLTLALNKLKYSNYRIFVGVYPNDLKTVKVVRDIARKDKRVILCLNVHDGPTTKADNLNNLYSCLVEYESTYGLFDVVLIHDSEDFIHPLSLKLFNYYIAYKGYYAIQIPVIPIKSKYGRFYHRTYCDAFAELHTKDLIVRQSLGSFMPFAGTGMGFSRNSFFHLEKEEQESLKAKTGIQEYSSSREVLKDQIEIKKQVQQDIEKEKIVIKKRTPIRQLSLLSIFVALLFMGFFIYNNLSSKEEKHPININPEVNNTSTVEVKESSTIQTENKKDDLTLLSIGYFDEKLNIIYIKENTAGYTLQESSWDDINKANLRKNYINKILGQNAANIVNVDMDGVTIYRIITGKYETLELARQKAVELRKKINK
jgi:hypothetical protein